MNNLEAALEHKRHALALTAQNDPERASRLQSLGTTLHERFQRLGDVENLEAAFSLAWELMQWAKSSGEQSKPTLTSNECTTKVLTIVSASLLLLVSSQVIR